MSTTTSAAQAAASPRSQIRKAVGSYLTSNPDVVRAAPFTVELPEVSRA